MATKPLPADDLGHILTHARTAFASLRDARIFLTGGTGFFGHWLLESLLHANRSLALGARVTILTRSAAAFRDKSPHIANDPAVSLLEGDIQSFAFPVERPTHILHAATDSGGAQSAITEAQLAASIVAGTQRVLALAAHSELTPGISQSHQAPVRLLYISSGAVYGRNITNVKSIGEDYPLPPTSDPPTNYDQAKRAAEVLCLTAANPGLEVSIARCFAFAGPHLPLDAHFAIGNFIRNALAGSPIHIKSDGTPLRSFLYMSDLAIWLWTMLTAAPAGSIYNVGSDEAISIASLAQLTAETLRPGLAAQIDGTPTPGAPPATYVPDISRATSELGLTVKVPLVEAIRRTAFWSSQLERDDTAS